MKRQVQKFKTLPNILIQDPVKKVAYLIPVKDLKNFKVGRESWSKIDQTTVTFVIPDPEIIEVIPPFTCTPTDEPSILIQYPRGKSAYFVKFEQLQKFKIDQPKEKKGYGISFILPVGIELIEELPAFMKPLLQSGESTITQPLD